ncbi:nitroreductase family protein [Hymenobacter latericus]|uniref:nitroreductase family protein n=1 Tax=Hymenobacter sp. YIM 151858-1 TaxID=2987688 RepID=UPI002226D997|nr:nitroreductase family protein [Hymenobacter sp. YIM 151858-1]UYZ58254.1 nitroreductase family protein [Hymenobacter sp. YIM 151858-1]
MNLLEALNWRYAAKRMNGQAIEAEKLNAILEATRLSASSMGLQPYTVLVVENPAVRRQIFEQACKQPQIVEGSHVLVFAAWADVTEQHVDAYLRRIQEVRGVPAESLADFRKAMLGGVVAGKTPDERFQWAARQAYIALGTALAAAAVEQVDATPMEGFNPAALDALLNLPAQGLRSVSLLALGYRDAANDHLASAQKVRRSKEQFFVQI